MYPVLLNHPIGRARKIPHTIKQHFDGYKYDKTVSELVEIQRLFEFVTDGAKVVKFGE